MTLKTFLKKAILYFPRRIKKYLYDMPLNFYLKENEIKTLKKIMKGKTNKDFTPFIRKKIVKILKYSYKTVPYWKQFTQIKNINYNNCLDILETLPLLNKDIIKQNGNKMWKPGKNPNNMCTGSTGGTTGEPLVFLRDYAPEDTHQPALYEYMTGLSYCKDIKNFGKLVSFDGTRPSDVSIRNNIFWTEVDRGIYGSVDFCSFYETEQNFPFYIQKLNELKPYVIRGYSNSILSLANYIIEQKKLNSEIKLNFSPKGIYVTSEYCSLENMKTISKAFNCNVFGQYGQCEALHFSWTKPNSDTYYCSPFYGYVEIVDSEGKHVKEGEIGEVCITGYYNKNQPFIRYLTGDMVKYGGSKNGIVCLSELKGRKGEYLYNKDDEIIQAVGYLDIHYLKCKDRIINYQIEQNEIGKVIFRIVKKDNWSIDDENEIIELLKIRKIDVSFEYVSEIPLTKKGKKKSIIQNIIV